MNITTFNERFGPPIINLHGAKLFAEWCKTPLFCHEMNFDRANEQGREEGWGAPGWEFFPLPFPMLRANLNTNFERAGSRADMRMFARVTPGGGWEVFFFVPVPKGERGRRESLVGRMQMPVEGATVKSAFWSPTQATWISRDDPTLTFLQDSAETGARFIANVRNSDGTAVGEKAIRFATAQAQVIFMGFAHDSMAPTNHIAEVRPVIGEPRSVEWMRARTHYTLIAHGHPANKKTVGAGDRVAVDAGEELSRLAHNRRAHYRTLRHERYRFAKGRRIFVRSTWVGPKEWQDEGGRQIYKILDPVEESPEIYRFTK